MTDYIPGLLEPGDEVDVTYFPQPKRSCEPPHCEGCGRVTILREIDEGRYDSRTGKRAISRAYVCPRYDRQWRNLWLGGWKHYGYPIPDGDDPFPLHRLEWA